MLATVARESRRARTIPRRSPLHERDAGALDRDVGARAHRDPDVRRRQRGRVVDAVAGHRDRAPGLLQRAHHLGLALGQHLGLDLVDAELARDRLRRGAVVAR